MLQIVCSHSVRIHRVFPENDLTAKILPLKKKMSPSVGGGESSTLIRELAIEIRLQCIFNATKLHVFTSECLVKCMEQTLRR